MQRLSPPHRAGERAIKPVETPKVKVSKNAGLTRSWEIAIQVTLFEYVIFVHTPARTSSQSKMCAERSTVQTQIPSVFPREVETADRVVKGADSALHNKRQKMDEVSAPLN